MRFLKKYKYLLLSTLLITSFCVSLYHYSHWYGFNVLLSRGGTLWKEVSLTDTRLSPAMRLALQSPDIQATAGELNWRTIAPGFEAAELDVLANGQVVDRLLLNRIDPQLYQFSTLNAPAGNRDLKDWEAALPNAMLIVNGSYFDRYGEPSTPFISNGKFIGVSPYKAKAGAFVAKSNSANVIDLSQDKNWKAEFSGAQNAMVSFPLLIGEDGENHVRNRSLWLANRTFVAEDKQGRIIIGTTEGAFFSIYRLAEFLRIAPLDIKVALNLDGGPVACQSVRAGDFHRHFIAKWELQADQNAEHIKLLTWPFGDYGSWAMAVVLVVTPKNP